MFRVSLSTISNNAVVFLLKRLWQYSGGNRRAVVGYFGLFFCANIIGLAEPLFSARVMDVIQDEGISEANFWKIVFLTLLIFIQSLVFWMFHGPARVIERKNAFLVQKNYKMFLLNGVLGLPASWHTDHHSGDTIDKIEKGSLALREFGGKTFEMLQSVFGFVGSVLILGFFHPPSLVYVIGVLLVVGIIINQFDKQLVVQYNKLNKISNEVTAKVYDIVSNITTVIILRIERLVSGAVEQKMLEPFSLLRQNFKTNEYKWFYVSCCSNLTVCIVLISYFYSQLQSGVVISAGAVYLLYRYIGRVTEVFFNFTYQYGDWVAWKTDVLNAEQLSSVFQTKNVQLNRSVTKNWKEFAVENLSFSYHTQDNKDLHLDDVSVVMKRGERIALIGQSGSGKTTFLKVMRGLYEPRAGKVLLDGKPLERGFEALGEQIALIPQEPEIFTTTIRENITVGVQYPLSKIQTYTDMACFTPVVSRLPNMWESSIVEKGVNLSGGEKQRLALARGLMACENKTLILLDEPTSSVDLKNESLIYQNIFRAFKDTTIISSIHRLHLLHLFDTIYFFRNGRLIANGSLREVLQTSKAFQTLWKKYQKTQSFKQL